MIHCIAVYYAVKPNPLWASQISSSLSLSRSSWRFLREIMKDCETCCRAED
jgi:hypothetical protein